MANDPATGQPFLARFVSIVAGGAAARAGVHENDIIDLREQTLEARVGLAFQPLALKPIPLVVRRSGERLALTVVPGTIWNVGLPFWSVVPGVVAGLCLVVCALLIVLRRSELLEARILAFTLACSAMAMYAIVVPNATTTAGISGWRLWSWALALLSIAVLSSTFGRRSTWRSALEGVTYVTFALMSADIVAFLYGVLYARIDPMPYAFDNFSTGWPGFATLVSFAAVVLVLATAVAAILTTSRSERARAAWLLLPIPLGFVAANVFFQIRTNYASESWVVSELLITSAAGAKLIAAFAVSYAVLKRRVLDVAFVLSRTLVFGILSVMVVAAFVLLEYVLSSILKDATRATGVVANALLALTLGISMSYLHKRVDRFVETVIFRKHHEDERALLDFSHEAAYVTQRDALLDRTIDKVHRHTDASSAAVMLDGQGRYSTVRAFGSAAPPDVDENDAAILALRAWHKPLELHGYATALGGALAVPMLARKRLVGVLVMGEREGGEAYTPADVETLSRLGEGVGAALETFSLSGDPEMMSLLQSLVAGQEVVAAELRALRGARAPSTSE